LVQSLEVIRLKPMLGNEVLRAVTVMLYLLVGNFDNHPPRLPL
jgi:hypothetical protein